MLAKMLAAAAVLFAGCSQQAISELWKSQPAAPPTAAPAPSPVSASGPANGLPASEAEWRKRLDAVQFYVLRQKGTEPKFHNAYWNETTPGIYHCAGCNEPLFDSSAKFDSGTGWPSYWQSLPDKIETRADNSLFSERTEVLCRRCGGHLGHVFDDARQTPTGKRYCINSAALQLEARAENPQASAEASAEPIP